MLIFIGICEVPYMKKIKKLLFTILFLLFVILVILNVYFDTLLKGMDRNNTINKSDLSITETFRKSHSGHRVTNIALFGVDNDDNSTSSLDEARSDAIKIISLDYDTQKIKMTSLERDLVVYLPGERQQFRQSGGSAGGSWVQHHLAPHWYLLNMAETGVVLAYTGHCVIRRHANTRRAQVF